MIIKSTVAIIIPRRAEEELFFISLLNNFPHPGGSVKLYANCEAYFINVFAEFADPCHAYFI